MSNAVTDDSQLCEGKIMQNHMALRGIITVSGIILAIGNAHAQPDDVPECDDTCQATRNAQDPTAAVNGVFFDNTFGFGPSTDNTSYNLQVQPIATALQEDWGDVVLRGIIPVLGVPTPASGGGLDTEFGLSDTILQAFYIPKLDIGFKFGIGPQISFATHTKDESQAAGWGGGIAGGGFGFIGPLSIGGIINHLWGQDDFSQTTVQPIVYYNVKESPIGAWFIGYNSEIIYDWSADDDPWQVPLGATVGKTFLTSSGYSMTFNLGAYELIEKQANGNDWQLQFSLNILFP